MKKNQIEWTPERKQFIRDNYPTHGTKFVAERLNLPNQRVAGMAVYLGVRMTPEARLLSRRENGKILSSTQPSKSRVNASFLTIPTTKEAAYILGFLWADGWIYETSKSQRIICLEIIHKDWNVIKKVFRKAGRWCESASKKMKSYNHPIIRAQVCNKELYNFLLEHDYKIKSLAAPTKILSKIPEHLKCYWWRGYWDGDGCFYYNKKRSLYQASTSGNIKQNWKEVYNLFNILNITPNSYNFYIVKNKIGAGSNIIIHNKLSVKKLCNFLYGLEYDNIGLRRKFYKAIYSRIQTFPGPKINRNI
jgi:hypothetical protein